MKIKRAVAAAILVFAVAFTLLFGKSGIADNGLKVSSAEYKGILTVWHVDTFEGGVGSRKQFLLSVSRGFEKLYNGVLVMVVDYTAESAEQAISDGKSPDIISYGAGVNVQNVRSLGNLIAVGGTYNGETYALPWARGGYCIIRNPDYSANRNDAGKLLVSQGEFTNPLTAYALSGKQPIAAENTEILSPMNAYVKFTQGKTERFLATQRDVHRLILRGMDFTSEPLDGYNDLYQYVSVLSEDAVKAEYARKFAEYLISEDVQKQLYKIGLFSCYFGVEYDSPDLSAMQKTEIKTVLSAFTSEERIKKLQSFGASAAAGNGAVISEIKKLVSLA
ncbi:MAG: hypothetical protein J6Y43_03040 [Clostridia bacterium]|nr:hypothetical protein [Clostridia bacterium]